DRAAARRREPRARCGDDRCRGDVARVLSALSGGPLQRPNERLNDGGTIAARGALLRVATGSRAQPHSASRKPRAPPHTDGTGSALTLVMHSSPFTVATERLCVCGAPCIAAGVTHLTRKRPYCDAIASRP